VLTFHFDLKTLGQRSPLPFRNFRYSRHPGYAEKYVTLSRSLLLLFIEIRLKSDGHALIFSPFLMKHALFCLHLAMFSTLKEQTTVSF